MAGTIPGRFTARFTDYNGIKAAATAYVKVAGSATITAMQADLAAWLVLLGAVSTAKITEAELTIKATGGVIGTDPTGWTDSDVINTAVLDFLVPANGRIWGFAVPSYADSLKTGGKLVADSGAISDLAAGMKSNTLEDFYSNTYEALGDLDSAFPAGRKRRGVRSKGRGKA
jgi:hypothetical protein